MFAEIADEPLLEDESALDELVDLSGGLPLAISLLANIVSFEGYAGTLARWKIVNTALLSDGHDKRSNLEKSIVRSLESPRISSSRPAKNLLSLLSLLPDGITDEDLVASQVPIPHVGHWRSLLVQTSLAYVDGTGRFKALSPIREYIRRSHPPASSLHQPARGIFPGLASYIGNINELMLQGLLHAPKPPTEQESLSANITIGYGIMKLNIFSRIMLKGNSPLMRLLPDLIESTGDSRLRWAYVRQYLRGRFPPVVDADAERFISQGVEYFNTVQCPIAEAVMFYNATALHYLIKDLQRSNAFNELAFSMVDFTIDNVLILESLDTKVRIANREQDTKKYLEAVREAKKPGRITSVVEELNWLSHEATAMADTGNYSRALLLIGQENELLAAAGLMASDKHLGGIDLQAAIHLEKKEYVEARKLYAVVISKTSPTHSPLFHAHALACSAYIDILTEGNDAEIVRNINAAEAVYTALGSPQESPCPWITSELYLYRGDLENARSRFEQCVFTSPYKRVVIHSAATLADPRHKMHNRSDTFRWAVVYLGLVLISKDRAGTFQALQRLADIFVLFDEKDTALNVYYATLEGATEMDFHCLRAECMTGIGNIMLRRGDSVQAKEMWEAAHTLFIRASQMKDAAAARARIDEFEKAEWVNLERLSILNEGESASGRVDRADRHTDIPGAMDKLSILSATLSLPTVEKDVPQSTTERDLPRTQDDGSTKIPVTV
ncbi:hypothetical protein K438DRAFT_1985393 [Mycena galopus ATCC 62051]|nr:hypothetical protein K438DRAFT_1985393 [Mycena galopus ATCC 62051]